MARREREREERGWRKNDRGMKREGEGEIEIEEGSKMRQ